MIKSCGATFPDCLLFVVETISNNSQTSMMTMATQQIPYSGTIPSYHHDLSKCFWYLKKTTQKEWQIYCVSRYGRFIAVHR